MLRNAIISALFAVPIFSDNCLAQTSKAICSIYSSHLSLDKDLIEKYISDTHDNSGNEVRKNSLVSVDKKTIEADFSKRNDEIFRYTSGGKIENLAIVVDKIESSTEDFGDGPKDYATIAGHIPCDMNIGVSLPDIPINQHWSPILSSLNVGDSISVSGKLIPHDTEFQRPADAIQWGGPLWGIFGGLREDALLQPALRMRIRTLIQR